MENTGSQKAKMETSVAAITELEDIANQLSDLNNFAVDINMRIMQFNDRVQGVVPRDADGPGANKMENSKLNGIKETIGYLLSALNEINSEASRLDSIG